MVQVIREVGFQEKVLWVKVVHAGFLQERSLGSCFQGQVDLVGDEESRAILSGQDGNSFPAPYRCGGLLAGAKVRGGESQHPRPVLKGWKCIDSVGQAVSPLGPPKTVLL